MIIVDETGILGDAVFLVQRVLDSAGFSICDAAALRGPWLAGATALTTAVAVAGPFLWRGTRWLTWPRREPDGVDRRAFGAGAGSGEVLGTGIFDAETLGVGAAERPMNTCSPGLPCRRSGAPGEHVLSTHDLR